MAINIGKRFTGPGPLHGLRLWLAYGGWRDLWLIFISIMVWIAVSNADDAVNQVQEGRRTAIVDQCRGDQAQDDVLRALINSSLKQRREEFPHRDQSGRTDAQRTMLAEELMMPLGGLELTTEEAKRACEVRLERAKADK